MKRNVGTVSIGNTQELKVTKMAHTFTALYTESISREGKFAQIVRESNIRYGL